MKRGRLGWKWLAILVMVVVVLSAYVVTHAENATRVLSLWPARFMPPTHLQRCYCRECKAKRVAQHAADAVTETQ